MFLGLSWSLLLDPCTAQHGNNNSTSNFHAHSGHGFAISRCASPIIVSCCRFLSSMREFASTLGVNNEEERVFIVACPRRLADITVFSEVSLLCGWLQC